MSTAAVKQFIEKMNQDETFAERIVPCKDKVERLALAREAGFEFSAEELNEMAVNGGIDINQTLSYITKAYESRGIRLFVRSGTGLFE